MENYSKGSEWRKWDLQVQTILDDNYVELNAYCEDLKRDHPDKWDNFIAKIGSEEDALKFDSKAYFNSDPTHSEKVRSKNYAKTFLAFLESFREENCCIAITDHNYDHSHLLDEFLKAAKKSTIKVICGVEINIMGVHMLALFKNALYGQKSFSDGIKIFLSKIDIDSKKKDGALRVSNKSYTDVINEIASNGGLFIYPHCSSTNGLFQEKGKTDRTHLADQFNYSEFNILQGMNKDKCERTAEFISDRSTLKSKYCFTLATDARCMNETLTPDKDGNYTWIKADPTFEGLKQITYEPESRVMIQANKPEDKPGYQVIDKIVCKSEIIFNKEIQLNSNLNSIVGGRSTGKSVLLTAIAKKLKTETPIRFTNKPEYDRFVEGVSKDIEIYWKDGDSNNDREIEFFRQGYMYDLATNNKKLSSLIEEILKLKGKGRLIQDFSSKKAETKKAISSFLNDLFQVINDIREKEGQKSDKGDHKGILDEIERLSKGLNELNCTSFSDEERKEYEKHKQIIEDNNRQKETLNKDIEQIIYIKGVTILRDNVTYELTSMSESSRGLVGQLFEILKNEVDAKWSDQLDTLILDLDVSDKDASKIIDISLNNEAYKKVSMAYNDSAQLSELEERLEIQRKKLFEIKIITNELNELIKQKEELVSKIIEAHKSYYSDITELSPKLSDSQDGLKIKAKVYFEESVYRDILRSALNQQSASNQTLSNYRDDGSNKNYTEHVIKIFRHLIKSKISLKGAYTYQSLAISILSECFYSLTYDLVYEGDNFSHMSDGKKAFVVLKLLLDFSDKNCPILIDQPEDDLDNRAIYLDLVKYIKKKKILRQIIVATHNPNIVVGADSELVIVANQHGIKNENHDDKKFEYITGSLEQTKMFEETSKYVLDSQGIREHVCEILEGGDIAFKLREKKYAI